MAHVPVNFELHDFQLSLNTQQSAKFHGRMKELGFESVQQGDTLIYQRGKSRITAFVVNGAALNFLPDFYDDTPGGTVYAIMEKMCMTFGGTMVGKYTIDGVNNQWDIRISQGMNLSGKADVGKREHVVDPNAAAHLAPSSRPQSSGGQSAQAVQTSPQRTGKGSGQMEEGQSGESTRDKLYRVFVEEQYQKYVEANGQDFSYFTHLVYSFNQQFPKEETQEEETWKKVALKILEQSDLTYDPNGDLENQVYQVVLYHSPEDLASNFDEIYDSIGGEWSARKIAEQIEEKCFRGQFGGEVWNAEAFIDEWL